tara:strand:- start:32 stop:325 length:294 start_codon:yes stop_codon:yes gene_type:complete
MKDQDKARRTVFEYVGNDCFVCKDYYTFYMTIRRTNLPMDVKVGRSPDEYMLSTSVPEYFYGFKTPEEAMEKGYSRAKELYNMRLGLPLDSRSEDYE